MTNPNEFDKLPDAEKSELLKHKGKFKGIRQTPGFIFGLYELNGFYVEFTFDEKENAIINIKSIPEPNHFNYSLDWSSKKRIDQQLYN